MQVAIALFQCKDSELSGSPSQNTLIKSAEVYVALLYSTGLVEYSCQGQAICHTESIKTESFLESNFGNKRKGRKKWQVRHWLMKRKERDRVLLLWPWSKLVFFDTSEDCVWPRTGALESCLLIVKCSLSVPPLEPAEYSCRDCWWPAPRQGHPHQGAFPTLSQNLAAINWQNSTILHLNSWIAQCSARAVYWTRITPAKAESSFLDRRGTRWWVI